MRLSLDMREHYQIMSRIRRKIAEIMSWDFVEFEMYEAGTRDGRPNWEIKHDNSNVYFSFTAFDEDDIHGLHMVEN